LARDVHIDNVEHVQRPILAIGTEYPDGHLIDPHQHRRGQLISSSSGVLVLTTPAGAWVMPPQRGMWIPPATEHRVSMIGAVSVQSLYLEPGVAQGMPETCQVVGISPFMRSLMTEALNLPLEYEESGRPGALMTLIWHELQQLQALPLSLQYPTTGALAARCRKFIQKPRIHETIDDWCADLGMSRRTFTRYFKRETGVSFMAWRQQACLLFAVPRLAAGESVTTVALDLGYENPAAFTLMFRRAFGSSPLAYLGLRASPSRASADVRPG